MYSFDDKWRRQLLEDALVMGLLETKLGAQPSTPSAQSALERVETSPSGRTRDARKAA